MKKINFSRLVILSCCIALVTLASVTHTIGQSIRGNTNNNPIITIQPVLALSNWSPVPTAGTMLARKSDGIFMTLNTAGLVPGTVATAWLGIFNTPAACATNPCTPADMANPATHGSTVYAGGKIIGADGTATFGGFRAVGDTTGIFEGNPLGLILPLTAQIDLVVRTHGAAILNDPNALNQQLTTFNGGCPPNPCSSIQISVNQQ